MIRVKVISKGHARGWLRQFPSGEPVWGNCRFIWGQQDMDYDWIFVYEDVLYPDENGRLQDTLVCHCPRQNTILITQEPPNIKTYGRAFVGQFGHVLTSQPEWALQHPGRIWSQPALIWWYGADNGLTYDQMAAACPDQKTKTLSTVCSAKQQRHTLHHRRFNFTRALRQLLPDLDQFGKGIRPVDDKSEAIDPYKYHIVVENYIGPHHITEKLPDAFLGGCLPFYAGAPDAADYFPPESFIPIDIHDPEGAAKIIQQAIAENAYEKRLPAILEARKLVLEKYNTFAVISKAIEERHTDTPKPATPWQLKSRKRLRRRPDVALTDLYDKTRMRIRSFIG